MKQILILIFLCSAFILTAQQEEKKVIKKEKVVKVKVDNDSDSNKTVSVNVDGHDDQRKVTIKTVVDGEEKVISWSDDGSIPEDIKKQLEEDDIDIQILGEGDAVFIGDDMDMKREVIVIKGDDDETIELDWEGDGEMPEEIKKVLKENDIDLKEIKRGAKGKKMKMRMMKGDRGHRGPHRLHMKGDNVWVTDKKMNKTYIGAQIGTADKGTEILDVMVDSPAHKAGLKKGDIITEINSANTKNVDDMMTLLSFFDVNDTVEVKYLRDGKSKSTKITLAERPETYR